MDQSHKESFLDGSELEKLDDGLFFEILGFAFNNFIACSMLSRYKEESINNLLHIMPYVSKDMKKKVIRYLQSIPLDVDLSGAILESAVDFICWHKFKIGTLRQISGERSNSLPCFQRLLIECQTKELYNLKLSICKQPAIEWAEALRAKELYVSDYLLKIYYESFTEEILSSRTFCESISTLTLQVFYIGSGSFDNIQIYDMTPITNAIRKLKRLKRLTFVSVVGETAQVMPFHLYSDTLEEFVCEYHSIPVKMGHISCPLLKYIECAHDEKLVDLQEERNENAMDLVTYSPNDIHWTHGGKKYFRKYYADFHTKQQPFVGLHAHTDCMVRLVTPMVPMVEWN